MLHHLRFPPLIRTQNICLSRVCVWEATLRPTAFHDITTRSGQTLILFNELCSYRWTKCALCTFVGEHDKLTSLTKAHHSTLAYTLTVNTIPSLLWHTNTAVYVYGQLLARKQKHLLVPAYGWITKKNKIKNHGHPKVGLHHDVLHWLLEQ